MNVPHCPAHGDTCMPMLKAGLFWCPTGEHLVVTPSPVTPKIPVHLRRLFRPRAA